MGSSLQGNKIKDTYKSLIKITDNGEASSSAKELSDGDGNDLGLYIDTDGVLGIGAGASYSLDISSKNDGVSLPVGTTANRPTGTAGLIRYNTSTSVLEYFDSSYKSIASESYVNTQITNLIDSSPATLDTLNELAAALNDDANFHTTITNLIATKEDAITGAATTITGSDLTADKAVVSNSSGKIAVSVVTSTELGYLSGTTSAVQTQIDGKQNTLTAGTGISIISDVISATGGGGGGGNTTVITTSADGDGSTVAFTLPNTIADEDNVQIFIDGVYQSKSNYSTSGQVVTFSTAPPTGTGNIELVHYVQLAGTPDIEVDSFNGDGSTVAFTLTSEPVTKNNLQIYIDGVYQAKANYSTSGTTLTFTTAPETGTGNIEVTHLKIS
jgi:hypothetical protein